MRHYPHIGMCGRSVAPTAIVVDQIDLLCTPLLADVRCPEAEHIDAPMFVKAFLSFVVGDLRVVGC
jgi:hypothetical protein